MFLPRTLIVIQVIFGKPFRGKSEFRSGDIEELTVDDIGVGNYAKALAKLVELGWVSTRERRERITRGGRPSKYVYRRTSFGRQEYRKLCAQLAQYNIQLQ